MAIKPNNRNAAKKSNESNAIVYKVVFALLLLCVGIVTLRSVKNYYPTISGMAFFDPMLPYILYGCLGALVVSAAVLVLWKNTVARTIFPWIALVSAMGCLTSYSMRTELTEGFSTLYFLWAAALLLYIILQLYRWEFFLFSLPTAMAGFLFYRFSYAYDTTWTFRGVALLVVCVAILVAVFLIALFGSKNKGRLGSFHLFSKRYNPMLHFLVCGLWAILIPAALLLGSLFAYYCMFATIAVEFIAAVYYTFQLN